ncbi:MAG: MBL fold metallo-hydrolase [bacterium]
MKLIKMFMAVVLLGAGFWFSSTFRTIDKVQVTTLDVGQGDAILIKAPNNFEVLIDSGPDNKVVEKVGEYLPFFDREIELAILTHPDADHVNGFAQLGSRYRLKNVVITGVAHSLPSYIEFLKVIKEQGSQVFYNNPGQKFEIPGGVLTILAPEGNYLDKEVDDQNATSIVARLDVGSNSFLFTGDADIGEEKWLINSGQNIQVNVLKVGHHGSKSSTSPEFVKAVNPDIGLISAGQDNKFGHPHQELLGRLDKALILSTAIDGDICIEVDEEGLGRC